MMTILGFCLLGLLLVPAASVLIALLSIPLILVVVFLFLAAVFLLVKAVFLLPFRLLNLAPSAVLVLMILLLI